MERSRYYYHRQSPLYKERRLGKYEQRYSFWAKNRTLWWRENRIWDVWTTLSRNRNYYAPTKTTFFYSHHRVWIRSKRAHWRNYQKSRMEIWFFRWLPRHRKILWDTDNIKNPLKSEWRDFLYERLFFKSFHFFLTCIELVHSARLEESFCTSIERMTVWTYFHTDFTIFSSTSSLESISTRTGNRNKLIAWVNIAFHKKNRLRVVAIARSWRKVTKPLSDFCGKTENLLRNFSKTRILMVPRKRLELLHLYGNGF